MSNNTFGKEERSLLRSREIMAWGQLGLVVAFLVLGLSHCSSSTALENLSNQKLIGVQLCNGGAIYAEQRFGMEREDIVIQTFASDWVSQLWSWDGKVPGTKEDDIGVKTQNGNKVPVNSWVASLAVAPQLAVGFLNELSKTIPNGVYQGQYTAAIDFRYISNPREVAPGIWDINILSDRIVFDKFNKRQLKPKPFNKTLRIRAVPIAEPALKENANVLEQTLYQMKAKGLQIISILDYKP